MYHIHVHSLSDSDKDADKEINHWSRRTSDKMHSDWPKRQEHLSALCHVRMSLLVNF